MENLNATELNSIIDTYCELAAKAKEIEDQMKTLKSVIVEQMDSLNVKKLETAENSITLKKAIYKDYDAAIAYLKEKAPSTLVLKVDATKVKSAINVGMLNASELAQYTKLSERISLTPTAKNN